MTKWKALSPDLGPDADRPSPMHSFLAVAKALSDENRVRAVMALRDGELCLCQIIALLELAPSTVSRHMTILAQAGLVSARKHGRWHYYRLAETGSPHPAMQWALAALPADHIIQRDRQRLRDILAMEPQALCTRYTKPLHRAGP